MVSQSAARVPCEELTAEDCKAYLEVLLLTASASLAKMTHIVFPLYWHV